MICNVCKCNKKELNIIGISNPKRKMKRRAYVQVCDRCIAELETNVWLKIAMQNRQPNQYEGEEEK